jgi:hypothetical protein
MSPPQISGMSPPIVEPMKILIQMYDPMLQRTTERFQWPHPDQEAMPHDSADRASKGSR